MPDTTFTETESRWAVTRGGGMRNGKLVVSGYRFSVWGNGNILEVVVMVVQESKCN